MTPPLGPDLAAACADLPTGSGAVTPDEAARDVSDAATLAFDEIAAACGCPSWEYPGQVVRDVLGLAGERDALKAENERVGRLYAEAVTLLRGVSWEEFRARMRDYGEMADRMGAAPGMYPDERRCAAETLAVFEAATAALRAVVDCARAEHAARAAWLSSLPAGACTSPPSDEDFAAHDGWWLVASGGAPWLVRDVGHPDGPLMCAIDDGDAVPWDEARARLTPGRWWKLDRDGRLLAPPPTALTDAEAATGAALAGLDAGRRA